jgi:hypothetical protein
MNTRSSKEYQYIFTTTWKQAPLITPHDWLTMRAASAWLSLSCLIFSCCQLPFCEFTKLTTALHYRYDTQIYCTFLIFVNQHFPGLPASGTHCMYIYIYIFFFDFYIHREMFSRTPHDVLAYPRVYACPRLKTTASVSTRVLLTRRGICNCLYWTFIGRRHK